MGVHHEDRAENASECSISHLQFQNFSGEDTPGPSLREGRSPHAPFLSTARACAAVAVTHTVTPVVGAYILRAFSVFETFRRPCVKDRSVTNKYLRKIKVNLRIKVGICISTYVRLIDGES